MAALALACGGSGSGAGESPSANDPTLGVAPTRGNVLVLVADDLGVDMLASYGVGTSPPSTPVLDQLAANGVRFRTAWSHPICSPTRASIHTGRSATRNGIGWNTSVHPTYSVHGIELDELTLPEMLRAGTGGAYRTAAIGKWHLGHTDDVGGVLAPNVHGYDHFSGTLGNLDDHYAWPKVVDGQTSQSTRYALTEQIDDALAFIQGEPGPWFCYVAFNNPHGPLHAPPAALHGVDLTPSGDAAKDDRAKYEAMVEALDTEIGRLLVGLGAALDDTTVIFVGDNGTPGQFSLPPFDPLHGKGTMYEGGVGVPLIIAGPAVEAPGSECAALVHVSDLYATVAALGAVDLDDVLPVYAGLDSFNLLPYLADPGRPSARQTLIAEYFFPNGPGEGAPEVLPDLGASICQPDLGFGGPGTMRVEICGSYLALGNAVDLEITGAPSLAPGVVLQSWSYVPKPFAGGVVTASPAFGTLPFLSDAQGSATIENVHLVGADVRVAMQAVAEDPSLPGGFALSNTILALFHPWNYKAARDERYKLIRSVNGGPTELYDLAIDPLETDNLMAAPLSAELEAARARLQAALDDL